MPSCYAAKNHSIILFSILPNFKHVRHQRIPVQEFGGQCKRKIYDGSPEVVLDKFQNQNTKQNLSCRFMKFR